MAIVDAQHRRRRCGSKVKTGCETCKVRRIKCDEAKPSCQRCLTTGRTCDGYRNKVAIFLHTPQKYSSVGRAISENPSGNVDEKRGFDFFVRNTAAEFSGYYDSFFWEQLVLSAATQSPPLRHAVIALGALHEDFARKRLLVSPNLLLADSNLQFALSQYTIAINALQISLSTGKEKPLIALMSCVLFVCFDSLRGWFESAMIHLQSGLKILRDMRKLSVGDHVLEDKITPLLVRLSIQSTIYVETKCTHYKSALARELADVSVKEIVFLEEFKSLEEARNVLNQTAGELLRMTYIWNGDLPISSSIESRAISGKCIFQLSQWNLAFGRFLVSKGKGLTSGEVRGATLLKVHCATAKIIASSFRPDTSDMSTASPQLDTDTFLGHLDDFQMIINLSKSLVAAMDQDVKEGKPPFTFSSDLGLIGPLYYVCVKCPDVVLQNTAMELLLRCPRREGMWNSIMVAQMIQQFWDLREKYKEAQEICGVVDESVLAVPFSDGGSVHFAFFGMPADLSTTSISNSTAPRRCLS